MAQCSKSNCKKPATKNGLCDDHNRLKQIEDQKQATQKAQMEKQAAAAKAKETQVVNKANKNEADKLAKAKRVGELATLWNTQVNAIVTQVVALRKSSGKPGINAGKNAGHPDIPGGSDNPLKFAVPSPNPYGVATADVFAKMKGFESSDSSGAKFRINGVFVHCH